MQNTMAETPDEKDMNDILASIRQTITNELGINIEHKQVDKMESSNKVSHDDVLELTQQVQDDGSIVDLHKQIADLKSQFQSLSEFNNDINTSNQKKHVPYFANDVPLSQPQPQPQPQPQFTQSKETDNKSILNRDILPQTQEMMDVKIHNAETIDVVKADQNAKAIDDIESMAEKFASSYNKQQDPIPKPTFKEQILSDKTVQDSLHALTNLQQLSSSRSQQDIHNDCHQQTIDSLVRELLKPMLKEWLDANLPSLVKWIVTEQIERIMKERKL